MDLWVWVSRTVWSPEQVVQGKLQGGAFTPKAFTDAEASKVDSHLARRTAGNHGEPFFAPSVVRVW